MKRLAVFTWILLLAVDSRAQWTNCTASNSQTCTTSAVGIGTTAPTQMLHVWKDQDTNTVFTVQNLNVSSGAAGVFRAQSDTGFVSLFAHGSVRTIARYGVVLGGFGELSLSTGNGLVVGTIPATPLIFGTGNVERMRIDSSGHVGIGVVANPNYALDVAGTIHATNVIGASYQDVAEWVPASQPMTPGTVVVLNTKRNNEVMPSFRAYDTHVAGVVSRRPGVLLGEGAPSKEKIATTGRVMVRVTASNGAIHVGDLIVTSDTPGTGMRSEPIDVGGVRIHRPGTLIGKALEALPHGVGEILVLLSLQ